MAPIKKKASKKAVVKSKPKSKTVTKKETVRKAEGSKIEVIPKILTGEGLRRRRLAALKNKK